MENLLKDYEKALENMIKVIRGKEDFVNNVLSSINLSVNVIELENLNIIL